MNNKVIAVNGSPKMDKGNTDMLLSSFLKGMEEAGARTEVFYADRMKIKPCSCGKMYCWYDNPGVCCYKDEMQDFFPKLKEAGILVLATPVYIPLPGKMQDFINRLCPLILPYLERRDDRTRARFRKDVNIEKMVLVSTGGWWEKENFNIVVQIVEELAKNSGVEFAGALIRPHSFLMKSKGAMTEEGERVLIEAKNAGISLIKNGFISRETLDSISRPLISEEELRERYNRAVIGQI